jgi:hypothetical protein
VATQHVENDCKSVFEARPSRRAERFFSVAQQVAYGLHNGRSDPPFGGLWCDQPAIFLLAERRLAALSADIIS